MPPPSGPPRGPPYDAQLYLAAGRTVWLYDFMLTFQDEVQYVWKSRPSVVKYLFLFCRYGILIPMIFSFVGSSGFFTPSVQFCQVSYIVQIGLYAFVFGGWNWLLATRVHAILSGSKKLQHVFTVSSISVALITAGLSFWEAVAMSHGMTVQTQSCTPGQDLPSLYWISWLPPLVFNLVMFLMGMSKLLRGGYPSTALRNLLIRDGFIYWAVISAMEIVNIVLYTKNDPEKIFRFMYIYEGLGSALVSRMVLNLRSFVDQTETIDLDAAAAKASTHDWTITAGSYQMRRIDVVPPPPVPQRRLQSDGLNVGDVELSAFSLQDLGLGRQPRRQEQYRLSFMTDIESITRTTLEEDASGSIIEVSLAGDGRPSQSSRTEAGSAG
ncbi:hypothetical protein DL93DRAFT_2071063 [Clavulina sp. PMI_390]|nr:hypothetical protein DL93DRAFT_2071063 [Clavulina sp. PMI_390]